MGKDNGVYKAVSQTETKNAGTEPEVPKGFGIRHVQTVMLFSSLAIGYTIRSHLSVTIVAMTEEPAIYSNNSCIYINELISNGSENLVFNENNETDCGKPIRNIERQWGINMSYKWNKATEEIIMFAFFLGYTSANLPMGLIAQRFGWKIPVCIALFCNGILSILTPWMATWGDWWAVCILRLCQGLTQGAYFPSIHSMLGKWAPFCERGRLSTLIYTGSQFGTIIAFQIAGVLAGSSFGWPSTFILLGVLSLVCFGLVLWFGADSPNDHPTITQEELLFITGSKSTTVPKRRKTPWRSILTCPAVWGIVVSSAGSTFCYVTLLTQIPLYMNNILNVNIKNNGLLSSLPYISMYIMMILLGMLSDFVTKRKYLSIVNIRRINNTIGMVGCVLVLFLFGFVSNTYLAVTLLVISMGLHSGIHLGFHINYIDLAPNFAGPMMALGNTVGNLMTLFIPLLVSSIIKEDMSNPHRWQILFGIVAAGGLLTNSVYVILARGEVQPWNFYDGNGNDNGTKKEEIKLNIGHNEKETTNSTSLRIRTRSS